MQWGCLWVGEKYPKVETNLFDFIYTNVHGYIKYGSAPSNFNKDKGEECTIETVKTHKIVPVLSKEIITIDGKQYDKEAVLERLAELKVLG